MSDWITAQAIDLEATIAEFKRQLPGWWFSVGECSVSCDASCGPDRTGPDKELLWTEPTARMFDDGFHVDLPQPSTLAEALQNVMRQALAAKAGSPLPETPRKYGRYGDLPEPERPSNPPKTATTDAA